MNRLAQESSPYLLLHKDDPVDWYPWGPEALAAAEAQNKPILLSIGYTACHWCHVMAKESFADAETAALMNASFINIKVDREERPDIDQLYQAAANTLGNSGGWPLTMFLTPRAAPYFAGTFFPIEERLGQPAFKKVLADLAKAYGEQSEQVAQTATAVTTQLTNLWNRDMRGPVDANILDTGALRIGQRYDIFFGGQTSGMKFPSVTSLEVLWRAFLRTGMPQFLQLTSVTLDNILLGGLYDHIGGGFARYCSDERWLVPQFEKMLNDNAMLLEFMTGVWQFNRNALCRSRIEDTVAFLLRDMRNGDAFSTSIDAESDGEEGKYYLWSEAEIDAALMGTFVAKFKTVYNVVREGRYQGKNVLQRLGSPAPFPQSEADEALLAKQREMLLAVRQQRHAPAVDTKIIADWNGLAIAALANAGAVFQKGDWTTAAIKAFDFIVKALGDGDRLYHSWCNGKRGAQGFADDYANMARAALILYETVGEKRYLDRAKAWVRTLNEHFWDTANGGYFFTPDDAQPLIVRARMVFDQPSPSANGTMLQVLARLVMITGQKEYSERVNAMLAGFAGEAARAWQSMPSFFNGLEYAATDLHLIVVGPLNNPKTHELSAAILGRALPNRCLSVIAPEEQFPEGHPMRGKGMQNGQPTAYICQRQTVSAPITNPVTLSQMLQLPQRPQAGALPQ
ncbi:MAG TPA: thioredoxin domain-containing protein [Rhizomicrobium sp.]|nr:thioredoxin domain-containing protein [Rhizomicrobium sp.]